MKRMLAMISALLMLLSGCTAAQKEGARDAELAEENRYLASVEQRAARIGDVFYYSDLGPNNMPMILAVDLNSMESFPLCAKPECEHKDPSCEACAGESGPVMLTAYRDRLYYLDTVFGPITSAVFRMEPDGSGRTEVTRLNSGSENASQGKSASWFGIYGGKVYRAYCADYVLDGEPRSTAVLYSQPLEANSEGLAEELLRVEGAVEIAACIEGGALYFSVSTAQGDRTRFSIYAFDLDRQTMETLYSEDSPFCPMTMACVENALLFGYNAPAFRFSLTDRSITELPLNAEKSSVVLLGGGMVFMHTSPSECRIADYEGKLLYEGVWLPPELVDKDITVEPLGFTGGVFYHLVQYSEGSSSVFTLTAFDTADHTGRVLRICAVQNDFYIG